MGRTSPIMLAEVLAGRAEPAGDIVAQRHGSGPRAGSVPRWLARLPVGGKGPGSTGRQQFFDGAYRLGWGVTRRYGLTALYPLGNFSLASSSDTEPAMTTSSPSFQFTGVAT